MPDVLFFERMSNEPFAAMTPRAQAVMRGTGLIFLLATAVNYAWELAQTPLYAGVEFPGALWHCFVASLGDGLLVLFIYATVAIVARSPDWYMEPTTRPCLAMAVTGLAVGVAVEWWGLHIARRWQYSELTRRMKENASAMSRIGFFRVPLVCEAASHIGCGTRARPVVAELEREAVHARRPLRSLHAVPAAPRRPRKKSATLLAMMARRPV